MTTTITTFIFDKNHQNHDHHPRGLIFDKITIITLIQTFVIISNREIALIIIVNSKVVTILLFE